MNGVRYVLPQDVTLVASRDLDDDLRVRLGAAEGEFAIDRPRGRTAAKLIDANTVALVRQFRRPTTMAQAIVRTARARGADAVSIVPEAFVALRHLIAAGYLFEEGSASLQAATAKLAPRSKVSRYQIRECVRLMQDVELYLADDEAGNRVAIKRWRDATAAAHRIARREAARLAALGGRCAPQLIETSLDGDEPWIAMAWCHGISADAAADEARMSPPATQRLRIGEVLRAVGDAYATLHAEGIVHGDVHGGNCLIDRDGRATLVDFGLARDTRRDPRDHPDRGGVFAYFEPEYARAALANEPPPEATFASEQYAIASLLFRFCTGLHHLDFDPSQERAWRQLVGDPPRSFDACGAPPWPALEAVLQRALAKDAAERFETTRDFADAVAAATTEPFPTAAEARAFARPPMRDLTLVWRRLAAQSTWARRGYTRAPVCSVTYGAAGAALACYRRAVVARSAAHLAVARHWMAVAESSLDAPDAFYDGNELTRRTIGAFSTHHGPLGVWLTSALVSHASGDERGMRVACSRWRDLSRSRRQEIDLTLGRAGVVNSGATLVSLLSPAWPRMAEGIRRRARAEHAVLLREVRRYAPIGDPRCRLANLGAAHGWSGVLLALLRWRAADKPTAAADAEILRRLDELSGCGVPAGRGLRWPWHDVISEADDQHSFIGGWCNGSAGITHLWLESYAAFRRDSYLELAHGAAWHTWEYDDDAVESLCCGLAGRAYALLAMYRVTGEMAWYDRARELAARAAASVRLDHPESLSLYRGALGVALLSEEIDDAHTARMPAFEMEPWAVS